jgi:putative flavoprotein involved in K+ transport
MDTNGTSPAARRHVETVIVGAGQAGLSTAYHLTRRGLECLVVDGAERVGDNWRHQWDTLRLYTPAKYDGLPGMAFPKDPWDFPQKDEVADFLETYARTFELPVRLQTRVESLEALPGGGYLLDLGGDSLTCDNVVVATGSFGRTPCVPAFADQLDASIRQLHSSQYRRPSQLQDGKVLVVGASHSGMDIAYEVALTHETVLSGRDCGSIPVRLGTRKARIVLPFVVFVFRHVLTRRTPMGRKEMDEVRFHGGPALRVKAEDLAERGVVRTTERVTGVENGLPALADGTVVDARNVIWCTGFLQAFDWIKLPILDERGWPVEYRGVVEDAPGLFFCGLSFQFAFSSMVFAGVGRDSEHVARKIMERTSKKPTGRPAAAVA